MPMERCFDKEKWWTVLRNCTLQPNHQRPLRDVVHWKRLCVFSLPTRHYFTHRLKKGVVYLIHSTQPASSVTHSSSRSDYCRVKSNRSVISCV